MLKYQRTLKHKSPARGLRLEDLMTAPYKSSSDCRCLSRIPIKGAFKAHLETQEELPNNRTHLLLSLLLLHDARFPGSEADTQKGFIWCDETPRLLPKWIMPSCILTTQAIKYRT